MVPKLTARIKWDIHSRLDDGRKVVRDNSLWKTKLLYHFLPWSYVEAIFADRRLRLSPVRSWRDPYEGWWCDKLFNGSNRLNGVQAYGLCWTTSQFDEPFWRMAGFGRPTSDPIVRIRCRPEAILNAGTQLISCTSTTSLFLGSVRYRREKVLLDLAQDWDKGSLLDVSFTASEFLLHKRNAFRFEKEIRLIWFDREPASNEQFLPIDPLKDITQVMTTPHATTKQRQIIAEKLSKFGVVTHHSSILSPIKV